MKDELKNLKLPFTRKRFKDFVYQIVIIAIGVFIGLFADDISKKKSSDAEYKEYLISLGNDLTNVRYELNYLLKEYDSISTIENSLLNYYVDDSIKYLEKDSINKLIETVNTLGFSSINDVSLQRLTFNNGFSLMDNIDLKNELSIYYSTLNQTLPKSEQILITFYYNQFVPLLIEKYDFLNRRLYSYSFKKNELAQLYNIIIMLRNRKLNHFQFLADIRDGTYRLEKMVLAELEEKFDYHKLKI